MSIAEPDLRPVAPQAGLSSQEVRERLAQIGYNEVPEKRPRFLLSLAKQFWGVVPWMLELTAVLTWLLGKYPETIIVLVLLFFNAAMSLMQERRARSAMASLKLKLWIQSRVKRDGAWTVVQARELVPGDLIRLRAGDLVPADARLVEGSLDIDQSALTGESLTVEKSSGELAYSGSAVKRGEGLAVVDATGTHTYFGRTVELLQLARPKLHMEELTVSIGRRLAVIVLIMLLLAFAYALLTGIQLAVLLPLAAVLLIAAVPVAMPTMFTLNMAMGSSMLARMGMLVTRLSAIEDAAAMDVLCVDKTGTITMNKLFVQEETPASGFAKGDILLWGALASNPANQDPIDAAFLAAVGEAHLLVDTYSRTEFIPFDPKTRMTGATVERGSETALVRKGSLSAVLPLCSMAQEETLSANNQAAALSAAGLRVIAVAMGEAEGQLQLIGLAGVADGIRTDSPETVKRLKDLGVAVKMLTGDSLPIARNIAAQIGIGDRVITMPNPQDQEQTAGLAGLVDASDGIAEVYPEDKFRIVKALQGSGHIVGMTGDGFNDAPALKQAEVGIAVSNATDVAKESASAVLVTAGLSGGVAMIKTGRTIYQRIFSWVLNMITMKSFLGGYIALALFLTHHFVISIIGMVLLVLFSDIATMSLTMDNVRYSMKPDSLDVPWLFRVGVSLGALSVIEAVALTIAGLSFLGLSGSVDKLYTFGFAYVVLIDVFNLMVIRERGHFWKSMPGNLLFGAAAVEIAIVATIALFGFFELAPIGYVLLLAIIAYTAVAAFLLNDQVKVHLLRMLSRDV